MPQSSIAQWLRNGVEALNPVQEKTTVPVASCTKPSSTYKAALHDQSPQNTEQTPSPGLISPSCSTYGLPANVIISPCTREHIKSFRRLNSLLLPIAYHDYFYKETLEDEVIASVTRVALWRPSEALRDSNSIVKNMPTGAKEDHKLVAAIRCRVFERPPYSRSPDEPVLYISTIGTLAPFRDLSLASHLLEETLRVAQEQYGLKAVYAHVWEENGEALDWYYKRGFKIVQKEEKYYKRLAPHTAAWLIKRDIPLCEIHSNEKHRAVEIENSQYAQ